MKKLIHWLLMLSMLSFLLPAGAAEEELKFVVRNGSREEKKIALTVDDFFDTSWGWQIRDMWHDFGITGTFFPLGMSILPEDREEWQRAIDDGIEIGSHNWGHYKMGSSDDLSILSSLGRTQQTLDAVLGYHYQIHCFRPPFGNTTDEKGDGTVFHRAVKFFGYSHIILWDVSQTDPEMALRKAKNGSILLFHTRKRITTACRRSSPGCSRKAFRWSPSAIFWASGPMRSVRSSMYTGRKTIRGDNSFRPWSMEVFFKYTFIRRDCL